MSFFSKARAAFKDQVQGQAWDNLAKLEKWAKETETSALGHTFSIQRHKETPLTGLWSRLFPKKASVQETFADLSGALEDIQKAISELPEDQKPEKIKALKTIYGKIEKLWLEQSKDTSIPGLIQANDLLEAYNTAFRASSPIKLGDLHRIKASPPNPAQANKIEAATKAPLAAAAEVTDATIVLAEYQKLATITKKVQERKEKGAITKEEIAKLIAEEDLHIEPAPMGKMIDLLYRHQFPGRLELEKVVTQIAAWRWGTGAKVRSVEKTVKFFKNLHIDLWMEIGGELYSFSELFGYKLRDPKSYHESFTRSLTEEAKELIFEKTGYRDLQAAVRETLGNPNAQVICSNAFSRITVINCPAGSVDVPRSIRGKILDIIRELVLADTLTTKHPYTIHGMLGGFSTDPPDNLDETTFTDAELQGQLLGLITSFLDNHDATMVVQRLAPADTHHYYAPADSKVLSRTESCAVLQREIRERETLGTKLTPKEQRQLEQLHLLLDHFTAMEAINGKQATINIAGSTLGSVSTKAVSQEPGILATNDRKIMMVQHKDGSIAIHTFIGASAVNNVGVTATTTSSKAGGDFGWMSFGALKKAIGDWITAAQAQKAQPLSAQKFSIGAFINSIVRAVTGLIDRIRGKNEDPTRGIGIIPQTELGPEAGAGAGVEFEAGGSTVVSIYLKRNYLVLEPIEQFLEVGAEETEKAGLSKTIEIQCRLGDPLATPVMYQTQKLIESLPKPLEGDPMTKLRLLRTQLEGLPSPRSSLAEKWFSILTMADPKTAENLEEIRSKVTRDDQYLLNQLIDHLQLTGMMHQATDLLSKPEVSSIADPLKKLQAFQTELQKSSSDPLAQKWLSIVAVADLSSATNLEQIRSRVPGADLDVLDRLINYLSKNAPASPKISQTATLIESLGIPLKGNPLTTLLLLQTKLETLPAPRLSLPQNLLSILNKADPVDAKDIETLRSKLTGDDLYMLDQLIHYLSKNQSMSQVIRDEIDH